MAKNEKPDDDAPAAPGEPIDAEFETIEGSDAESGKHARPPRSRSLSRFAALLVIAVLLMLAAGYGLARKMGVLTPAAHAGRVKQADLAQLSGRIDSLQDRLEALRRDAASRLDALEQARAEQDSMQAALQSVQARLDALEQAAPASTGGGPELDALKTRLDALEERLKAGADPSAGPRMVSALQDIRKRLQALERQSEAEQAYASRLDALEQSLADIAGRLHRLEQRGAHDSRRAALALAMLALDDAARTGQPFVRQWQALAKITPQDANVLALKPLARTGAPTPAQLAQALAEQGDAIRAAASKPAGPGKPGLGARLRAGLSAMVSIRRVDGSGDGVDAVLARAHKALAQDDVRAALAALDSLDGAARQAAQDWIGKARARLRLDEILAQLKAEAGQGAKPADAQEATP